MRHLRALGGMAGVVIAVAGGIGAAVGLYTLPVPQGSSVGGGTYAEVVQRAFTASTLSVDDNGVSTLLRIEVKKGANDWRILAGANSDDGPVADVTQHTGDWFKAHIRACFPDGNCDVDREWRGFVPSSAFAFGATMDAARFSGEVQGCRFEVVWHPAGVIVPFENHNLVSGSNVGQDPWNPSAGVGLNALAELSRDAPADIQMTPVWAEACVPYSRQQAPGYLTQGAMAGPPTGAGFDVR